MLIFLLSIGYVKKSGFARVSLYWPGNFASQTLQSERNIVGAILTVGIFFGH